MTSGDRVRIIRPKGQRFQTCLGRIGTVKKVGKDGYCRVYIHETGDELVFHMSELETVFPEA